MSDPLQFETFMRDYQNMVFTTAYRLLGDRAEAEDISQEVFLKAYGHFDDLVRGGTPGGWLKTVTRNLCLSHLTRRRSRWTLFSEMDSDKEEGAEDFGTRQAESETQWLAVDATDRRELLSTELDKLPAPQRITLVLYHFHELSYEEIAARLKVSLSKVKIDIHRARQTLRHRLEGSRSALLS